MNKLIVCYIGQDVGNFLDMSLESIKKIADFIVFIDGGSKDDTTKILKGFCDANKIKHALIRSDYRKDYKGANGYQRNIYLDYVKKHFVGDICLVLDPDEVLSDNAKDILEVKDIPDGFILNVKMRHTIGDLAHEDATVREHFAPGRLFKIQPNLFYEEVEHPVLRSSMPVKAGFYNRITIWHLAYSRMAFDIKKRYLNHAKKSNIHSPEFLRWWYNSHISGEYPKTPFNITELPKPIKDNFMIDDDYYYFRNRMQLEPKHFIDAYTWINHFKPKKVLDVGCGPGQRVFSMFTYGIDIYGLDISEYAIKNSPFKEILKDRLSVEDVLNLNYENDFDLVICYDILEHIDKEYLDRTLDNIYRTGSKNFLFSIPFIGDPNLDNDPTHKIRMTKEQWIETLNNHGFIIQETPDSFLYKHQLLICKK